MIVNRRVTAIVTPKLLALDPFLSNISTSFYEAITRSSNGDSTLHFKPKSSTPYLASPFIEGVMNSDFKQPPEKFSRPSSIVSSISIFHSSNSSNSSPQTKSESLYSRDSRNGSNASIVFLDEPSVSFDQFIRFMVEVTEDRPTSEQVFQAFVDIAHGKSYVTELDLQNSLVPDTMIEKLVQFMPLFNEQK